MSVIAVNTPKYRHYKPKNLGVVRVDGRDHYLGKYNSDESWEKYHRLLAEHRARGGTSTVVSQDAKPQFEVLNVTEMTVRYYRYCERYYTKNGKPTSQLLLIKLSIKALRRLYGSLPCKDFAPLALKAVRTDFVEQGLSRRECNRRTQLIKQAFKWAVSEELCPPSVHHGLMAVSGLLSGRCPAKDHEPIGPVPEGIVELTLEQTTPTVEAMVRLQLASAMRPGEVCTMRAADLNMAGPIWEYRPATHKTEHHAGKHRVVMLGPKAQEIIRPFLRLNVGGYLFSPKQSDVERNAMRREERKTPLWPSHEKHQAAKRAKRGRKPVKDQWDVAAYRRAIAWACDAAFPHPTLDPTTRKNLAKEQGVELQPFADDEKAELATWRDAHRWHPNQLRHTAATAIRRQYGAEAAQAILGHSELSTTELYAEKNLEAARLIMREIG